MDQSAAGYRGRRAKVRLGSVGLSGKVELLVLRRGRAREKMQPHAHKESRPRDPYGPSCVCSTERRQLPLECRAHEGAK